MSICRSATVKEVDKNTQTVEKLKYTKTIDSNKVISNKGSFMRNKQNQTQISRLKEPISELRRAETNKVAKHITIEPPFKKAENNEKSTIFIDNYDQNKEWGIRESDIVFDLGHKGEGKDNNTCMIKSDEDNLRPSHKSNAQKNWGVILNVFKALKNMKHVNTKHVKSLTELDRTFNSFEKNYYPMRKKNNMSHPAKMDAKQEDKDSSFGDNFEEITKQIKLFDYVTAGLDEDLEKIAAIVKNDPMRQQYDSSDKEYYFINQKNSDGFTVLYIACSNGQTKMVDLLLKYNADHLQKCGIKEEEQSVLDVSIRWGHIKLVEYLLKLDWPLDYLKCSLKEALERKNEILVKMMKKAIADYKVRHKKKYCACFG